MAIGRDQKSDHAMQLDPVVPRLARRQFLASFLAEDGLPGRRNGMVGGISRRAHHERTQYDPRY